MLPVLSTAAPGMQLIPFTGQNWPGPGYRLSALPARNPSPGRAAGLYWKRPRHTNPLNPRALVRAEKRLAMFSHWVKRHFQIQKSMPKRRKARRRK